MTLRHLRPAIAFAILLCALFIAPVVEAQSILVNEFYRGGNLSATDEWIELVLTVPLTAAELNGFFVGDSTGTTTSKFSGYQFTNMGTIATDFPAGTIIVVGGTTALTQDTSYNPGGGDWNILLTTAGGFLTSNGFSGDLAGTDVVYVDTNGTNGNTTISASGFAVNWDSSPGTFGGNANVTIGVPANNTGVVLNSDLTGATTPANWSVSVALGSMTLGLPNGGTNTTYINSLRTPTLNINDVSALEGAAGTQTFAFSVTLTAAAPLGGVTFDIATADNTATDADNDYEPNSLTGQTIAAGSTGPYTFNVTVNGDVNIEATETFFVNVTNITNIAAGDTQGTGTITNDDSPPDLTINDVTQAETNAGTTTFSFTVSLAAPAPPGGVTFDIATADNTAQDDTPAIEDNDYVAKSLTGQTITAGNSSYSFDVTVNGDAGFEPNETFFVDVTNVTGANLVDGQGLGTINNDDAVPSFSIADVVATEGNAGTSTMTFTVTVNGGFSSPISVDVATADSSATTGDSDYVAYPLTTLTFNPGDTFMTVDVTINGDTNAEGDEQFFANLTNATGGATISDSQALGVVRNDDPISIAAVDTPVSENFDTLSSGTAAATTPVGWTFVETGTSSNLTYGVDTGGSTTGNTNSYGSAAAADRAFGGLQSGSLVPTVGALFSNDTGTTITSLAIQYTGEQWRAGATTRADRLDFQYSLDATSLSTGVWTDVDQLDFSTPNQTTTGAKDGNAAVNRAPVVFNIDSLSIAPGATFWIRFNDFNASGSDDGLAVDDFSITANYAGAFLSIDDVSANETNAGTTTFTFTVSLSQPAPPAGVTFDFITQDGTATTADSDYDNVAVVGATIPSGSSSYTININVFGDVTPEASENFFVNISNIVNALPQDLQGLGTIIDDDTPITFIHDIQGSGATSPIVGNVVLVSGIVTGVKSNGFFVQEEDTDADADPATSEGVFVFTSGAPPAAAAFGSQVQVSGTVAEFVPSGDPQQPPVTELTSPTVAQVAAALPLPTAVPLTATFPDPSGPFDQLERVEGMRVSIASVTVSGPSDGSFTESSATGTSNGRFHAVVTGVARPFREAGIQAPDVPTSGSIPPIPRWDFNPERLRIESATIGGAILTVKSGDVVAPIAGPLDYGFRGYAVYPDSTVTPVVTPGTPLPSFATAPLTTEVTVVSFNIQRFFDTVNDPNGDPILTAAAYQNRLQKASVAIRDHLLFPDIIGVQEAEKLAVLQDLAAQISADAITNAQADPLYAAYLVEGNDVGGIDVGYLVKTADVALGVPRVMVNSVVQEGAATTWLDPDDGNPALLNDRPPLVLDATVNHANGASFDVIVINNHLRSLIGIDSEDPDGLTTEGDRVRRKRLAQAEFLANLVQSRQTTDPLENIVIVGDFNAFNVNDGYTDVINVVLGTPPPDNETVVPGDGVDLVNPDLTNLVDTPPAEERYSYVHEGNAQNIDHAIVNAALVTATTARRIEHPRIDADYPETERNDNTTAFRISDHDPVVAYFDVPAFTISDITIDDVTVTEGNAGTTTATFTVSLNAAHPTTTISVDWTTTDNTAMAGGDFTGASGTVTFTPGVASQPIVVNVTGDLMFEPDETFFVDLSNVIGPGNLLDAQGLGTITNDDPVPTISIANLSAAEGSGGGTTPFTFTVSLSNPSSLAVTVTAVTADGSATSTFDFASSTALLTFAPGVVTQPFVVPVVADGQNEGDEAFFVDLQTPANATLLDGQAIGTILNDDDAPITGPDPVIVVDCLPVIGGPCMFTAVSGSGANQDGWSYTWYIDGVPAGSGQTFSPQFPGPGTYVITVDVMSNGEIGSASVTITILPSCPAGALCMQNGRFEIRLVATDPRTGTVANGVPLQENGQFGFFALPDLTGSAENPEVFVKILDGQPINGSFWIFFGGLTDLEYVLTVTDTVTGEVKTYTKPAGSSGGGFDVGSGVTPESCIGEVDGTPADPVAPGSCMAGSDRLCLLSGRFRIELTARDQRTGTTGTGLSIPENDMFGYFALPDLTSDATNPEVFVKVVDGRVVNGHFWIFFAGLTDLEYTVTVTDTTTGVVKSYTKAPGSACGGFDTDGF